MFTLSQIMPIVPIYKNGAQIFSYTGSTAETTLLTVSVPPAPGPNARLGVIARGVIAGSTNSKTIKFKYGGTIFSTQVIAAVATVGFSLPLAGTQAGGLFMLRNSYSAQIGVSDGSTTAPVIGAVNSTVSQDFVITGQLASAAETLTLEFASVCWYNF